MGHGAPAGIATFTGAYVPDSLPKATAHPKLTAR